LLPAAQLRLDFFGDHHVTPKMYLIGCWPYYWDSKWIANGSAQKSTENYAIEVASERQYNFPERGDFDT
jgi:hypothetical protein